MTPKIVESGIPLILPQAFSGLIADHASLPSSVLHFQEEAPGKGMA
jgi:hypothetical protein